MFKFIIGQLFLWHLFAIANGEFFKVNTFSGPIEGVLEKTFVNQVPYLSYKGIPYAEPPTGELRFKVIKVENFKKEEMPFMNIFNIINTALYIRYHTPLSFIKFLKKNLLSNKF